MCGTDRRLSLRMFEETLVEDRESLQAELDALLGKKDGKSTGQREPRTPRRQALPAHLRRVEHRHEPQDTTCACGKPMVRIGEDVSERLDIVPAEFVAHRHIRGKWACKCCQKLVQEPVHPQIIDGGVPTAALLAHLLVSRFVDHLPYYRIEKINARSGVHTPRSTLAAWSGRAGAALTPLYEALRRFPLSCPVLHVDETPVSMLDPGAGKTKRAYCARAMWFGLFQHLPAQLRPRPAWRPLLQEGSKARVDFAAVQPLLFRPGRFAPRRFLAECQREPRHAQAGLHSAWRVASNRSRAGKCERH